MENVSKNIKIFKVGQVPYLFLPKKISIFKVNDSLVDLSRNPFSLKKGYNTKKITDIINAIDEPFHKTDSDFRIRNLVINVTNQCNMACRYCFAKTNIDEVVINIEYVNKLIKELLYAQPEISEYSVLFFGGEPLLRLKAILEIVKSIKYIANCLHKFFSFSIATNGTLITDRIIQLLEDQKIAVTISIDGDEVGNKDRILKNGTSSFPFIVNGIHKLQRSNIPVNLHATFSPTNNRIYESIIFLENLGIPYNCNFTISSTEREIKNTRFSKKNIDYIKTNIKWIQGYLVSKMLNGDKIYCQSFIEKLKMIKGKHYIQHGCEAGWSTISLDEQGDYYPCQNMIPIFKKIGNVQKGINNDLRRQFRSKPLKIIEECQSCWARYLCGGGCQADRFIQDHSNKKKYICNIIKEEWTNVLIAYIRLYQNNMLNF